MSFAAVVVSYNRIDLLKSCLNALENQTRRLDEIIVVDNGSTDGSAEYVEKRHPRITLFRTNRNLGGAGGFAWGIEIALAHGHDGAWVMDDDAEPEFDAFAPLADSFESTSPNPVFLASLVTAPHGALNKGNLPIISTDAERQVQANNAGGIAIETATFVGLLINLHEAANTHLPLSDFFIWMDDSEYTRRLSRRGLAMVIKESRVNHPANKPIDADMGPRLFYYVRNFLWFIRERNSTPTANALSRMGVMLHCFRQLGVSHDKKVWLEAVTKGTLEGVFKRPRHQQPGELLRTLTSAQRDAIERWPRS